MPCTRPLAPTLARVAAVLLVLPACGSPSGPAGGGARGGAGGGSGGGGGGGTNAPSLEIARVDAAAECDGLVPGSAPGPVHAVAGTPDLGTTCLGGSADGTGHLVVGLRDAKGIVTWRAFAPDGAAGSGAASFRTATADLPLRQERGWQAIDYEYDARGEVLRVVLRVATPEGDAGATSATVSRSALDFTKFGWRAVADPRGGAFVASSARTLAGNHWWALDAVRVDPAGRVVSRPAVADGPDGPYDVVAGVSTSGDALVGWREAGGEQRARWLAADGTPRTDVLDDGRSAELFADAPVDADLRAEPLLDGGIALRVQGAWRWAYPRLGTHEAAPGWLASRPGTTLRFTRGNRGYALLPPAAASAPSCEQVVELFAPSGRRCGTVTVRQGATSCSTGVVEQGWDGTLVVQSADDGCDAQGCTCAVWAWPRLLAKP